MSCIYIFSLLLYTHFCPRHKSLNHNISLQIYIAEMAIPSYRGFLLGTGFQVMVNIGILVSFVLGKYNHNVLVPHLNYFEGLTWLLLDPGLLVHCLSFKYCIIRDI